VASHAAAAAAAAAVAAAVGPDSTPYERYLAVGAPVHVDSP
jgi:hypothetical protein